MARALLIAVLVDNLLPFIEILVRNRLVRIL